MFNENHQYYSLCMFFLEDYLELGKPYIFCSNDNTLVAEYSEHQIKLQINLLNLDSELYIKNLLDHRTNIYNYGRRYLLKKHIQNKGLHNHG
jgi:hypothetical protein